MKIWFVTDSSPWTRETLLAANTPELGGGIGGAEAMTVGLARGLARACHEITIFATKCDAPGTYDGVTWRRAESGLRRALLEEHCDVCVSVRKPEVFSLPEFQHAWRCRRVLWAQDILAKEQHLESHLKNVELIIAVSSWQKDQWIAVYPWLKDTGWRITNVAMDPAWLASELPRAQRRKQFIYSSRPERGLQPLLQMWPKIVDALPGARLWITGYPHGTQIELADRLILDAQQATPSTIEIRRTAGRRELFELFAQCGLMLYPGEAWFQETNGSVCTQAMAQGVVPLASRRGALLETVPWGSGILFDGDPRTPAYQDAFIAEVLRLSRPEADGEIAERQAVGRSAALPACSYDSVVEEWDRILKAWSFNHGRVEAVS